jgi:riboflavin kinase / FMN adenylyltransferase
VRLKILHKLEPMEREISVALGLFDGVHQGHRSVIAQAVEGAGEELLPVVLSFRTQHAIPASKKGYSTIITDTVKQSILTGLGVRLLIEPDFLDIKDYTAEVFVREILINRLRAKQIVCGYDYRFGKGAAGSVELLQALGAQYGAEVTVMPPLLDGGEPVSSTRIRRCIEQGEIEQANRLLGYDYCFDFPVIDGAKLGRTIGVPTINQMFKPEFLIPKFGVYASYMTIGHRKYWGVTNVGIKPTVHNTSFPLAETHIIGFSGDLYKKRIKVHLVEYLRSEQRFSGIPELKKAIQENIRCVTQRYCKESLDSL